jgi:hypothetical protein
MDGSRLYDALDPSAIHLTVADLLNNPSLVEGVAHDNGFHKLTLGQAANGIVLRAHIWFGAARRNDHCLIRGSL